MKRIAILLTGTVNPNNMVFTAIQDIDTRKKQYIDSIHFWIKKVRLPIVFVENSHTDLSPYFKKEIETNNIEFLHFDGNQFDRNLGKGYGELACIEHAINNSILLKEADFIFKITGRYKLINFNTFLDAYVKKPDVDLLIDFKWNLSFADSRFFGFSIPFVSEFLLKYKNSVDDSKGLYFEHILCKAALTAIAQGYNYRPLITLPRIEGYSASSGAKYNSNFFHWFRYKFEYTIKYRSFGLGNLPWI